MRGKYGRVLLTMALGVAIIYGLAIQTSAQTPVGKVLRRMEVHNNALQSLKADVTLVKYDAALKVTDTTIGETTYVPETKKQKLLMRLDWKTENGRLKEDSIAIKNGKFTLYQPQLHQVTTGPIRKGKGNQDVNTVFGFMTMPQNELKAKYGLVYQGEEKVKSGQMTWHLELTPKVKMNYKSADLWVDPDGMPVQVRLVAPNNDTTTILLSNLHKNETIQTSIFDIKYDKKKVKVVPR